MSDSAKPSPEINPEKPAEIPSDEARKQAISALVYDPARRAARLARAAELHAAMAVAIAEAKIALTRHVQSDAKLVDLARLGYRNQNGSKVWKTYGQATAPIDKSDVKARRKAERNRKRDQRRKARR
jgi:hypothetical protein